MEIGIVIWILSACACATWMSIQASAKGMAEFRWYAAGLVGNVLVLPIFLYMAARSGHETQMPVPEQHFDTLPVRELSMQPGVDSHVKPLPPIAKEAA